MWKVDNRTPFAVKDGWIRDKSGAETLVVAVKATFDIKPNGTTEISMDQSPVLNMPEYFGKPGKSSIKYESDLVLTKKSTDVLVVGHAYAPVSKPVTEIDVGFRVGPVQKMLRVFGDRQWGSFGATSPQPFIKMPLIYERAFGGVDLMSEHPDRDWEWRNPMGTGFVVSSDNATDLPLPNIEYPTELISSRKDKPKPAGFGPIYSHWQPRISFAGTYDENWMKTRFPLLPENLDDRFFQCAPIDQQTPKFLQGGEPCMLYRLTPEGELRFFLPKIYLGFETRFFDGSRETHKTYSLHTVIIEPDFPRLLMVWHTALPCHSKMLKLDRTIVSLI